MAIRSTEKEIQELLNEVKLRHPQAEFEISKNVCNAGTKWEFTDWELLEVRRCSRCGAKVLSAAIGEYGPVFCSECEALEQAEQAAKSAAAKAASARKAAWGEFHDSVLG